MELHDLATESSQGQVINLFPGADLGDRRVETSPALSYPARPDDARPLVD